MNAAKIFRMVRETVALWAVVAVVAALAAATG
jgi:hypothetical protein